MPGRPGGTRGGTYEVYKFDFYLPAAMGVRAWTGVRVGAALQKNELSRLTIFARKNGQERK
jgi:hypothetical protein